MLKKHLSERFTAKWWDPLPVDSGSLKYVLDCAYFAPSKQGRYNYKIYVLGDTEKSKEFKNWLYWENTWCLDKIRGKEGEGLKRFNGQVIAPVVLMWVADNDGSETRDDCLVSASVAMCAALEKGLQTGFNACLGSNEISEKLSITGKAIVCLGLGHATPDELKSRPVYSNDVHVGFDISNTNPKIVDTYNRVNKPKFHDLMIFL
jgi:nitroreductase